METIIRRASHDAMQHLHCDLKLLAERGISRTHFERRWLHDHTERWQQQQSQTLPQTYAYLDLTCLLAYYGIDYSTNVRRLMEPYQRFRQSSQALGAQDAWENLYCLPGYLAIVYHKQRDAHLLSLLLELRLSACHLGHAHLEAISGLWDQHWIALLRAAGNSQEAQRTLARALIHLCSTVGEPALWHACYRHLQSAIYLRERRLGETARKIIGALHQAEQRCRFA